MTPPNAGRHVLLIGSLPSESRTPRNVFELLASKLGPHIVHFPDGEQNDRGGWFWAQIDAVQQSSSLEPDSEPPWATGRSPDVIEELYAEEIRQKPKLMEYYIRGHESYKARAAAGGMRRTSLRVKDQVTPDRIEIGKLGIVQTEMSSYAEFIEAREAGSIPKGARYQVTLPTPFTFLQTQVRAADILMVLPAYERALAREIEELVKRIPAKDLTIQWDAVEFNFGFLEEPTLDRVNTVTHMRRPKFPMEEIVGSVVRLSQVIPAGVAIGFHLCYGDAIWGENQKHHALEPFDMRLMVEFTNCFISSGRPLGYVHMTVPVERDDDPYFAPLMDLRLPDDAELFLGLIHDTDGVEGAKRRANAAKKYVSRFGVSCECGLGRRPAGSTEMLLSLHRDVASSV